MFCLANLWAYPCVSICFNVLFLWIRMNVFKRGVSICDWWYIMYMLIICKYILLTLNFVDGMPFPSRVGFESEHAHCSWNSSWMFLINIFFWILLELYWSLVVYHWFQWCFVLPNGAIGAGGGDPVGRKSRWPRDEKWQSPPTKYRKLHGKTNGESRKMI